MNFLLWGAGKENCEQWTKAEFSCEIITAELLSFGKREKKIRDKFQKKKISLI